jgi:hypothetical protein
MVRLVLRSEVSLLRRVANALLMWLAVVLAAGLAAGAAATDITRVSQLREHLGQQVTVKGRTGIIVERPDTAGLHVFTLRDDYGDQVEIRSVHEYPIMGVTYQIAGAPAVDPSSSVLYLQEQSRQRVYPTVAPEAVRKQLLTSALVVVFVVVIAAVLVGRRVRGRQAAGPAELPEPWTTVYVVRGPHDGQRFQLRYDTIVVGRGHDPAKALCFDEDRTVSHNHGVIERVGSTVYYTDTNSRNGSRVNDQPVTPNERVAIQPGGVIDLGPNTKIQIGGEPPVPDGTVFSVGDVTEAQTQPTPGDDPTA